jgi:hypothetical protein
VRRRAVDWSRGGAGAIDLRCALVHLGGGRRRILKPRGVDGPKGPARAWLQPGSFSPGLQAKGCQVMGCSGFGARAWAARLFAQAELARPEQTAPRATNTDSPWVSARALTRLARSGARALTRPASASRAGEMASVESDDTDFAGTIRNQEEARFNDFSRVNRVYILRCYQTLLGLDLDPGVRRLDVNVEVLIIANMYPSEGLEPG